MSSALKGIAIMVVGVALLTANDARRCGWERPR
jgi:hypothetical protein